MLDLTTVRDRLLSLDGNPLRDIRITSNVAEAMREPVQVPRAFLLDLGESFGRNPLASGFVTQQVQVEFGVLLALPDLGRKDARSVLLGPRTFVRNALLGWTPGELSNFECRRGRLEAAGPVLWWLDVFATEYITSSNHD